MSKKITIFLILIAVATYFAHFSNAQDYDWGNLISISPEILSSTDDVITLNGERLLNGEVGQSLKCGNYCNDTDGMINPEECSYPNTLDILEWTETKVKFKFQEYPSSSASCQIFQADTDRGAVTNHLTISLCSSDTWLCGNWSSCSTDGIQTRICNKDYDCPRADTPKPTTTQSCTPECTANDWTCSNWSSCSSYGTQTRTCSKTSNCAGGVSSPATTQSCTYIPSCSADTWQCSNWGTCSPQGVQTRSCSKTHDCPSAETAAPATSQYCIYREKVDPEGFQQDKKGETKSYSNVCKNGYVQQGNKCVTHTKLCKERFGENSYGEGLSGESKNRTGQNLGGETRCYCEKGYTWKFGGGYCVQSDYDDGISITQSHIIDEYTLVNLSSDSDGDGILNEYDKHPNGGDKTITREYNIVSECQKILWRDKKNCENLSVVINIPEDRYFYYKDYKNHAFTKNWNNIASFVIYDDPVITDLVNQFYKLEQSSGISAGIIAPLFVNKIVYETDIVNTGWDEYPKYPIETIMDGKGDCEDTSYLMAAVLKAMNSDAVLVKFTGHLAIADVMDRDTAERWQREGLIKADYMWKHNIARKDDKYLRYIETTANNTDVGYMPEVLRNEDYQIYEIADYKNNNLATNNIIEEEKGLMTKIDNNLSNRLAGGILLQVEKNGEGW